MSQFVFPPAPQTQLPVIGQSATFPVRRIYCVGQNYRAHAREMGSDPDKAPPFFFSKPASAIAQSGTRLIFPSRTQNLHHEAELVVAIGATAQNIAPDQAFDTIWGVAAGNDLTRRDLQAVAKKAGRPWDMAKGFDQSAVIGAITPIGQVKSLETGRITAKVNGGLRQDGDLGDMTWPVEDIISHLSRYVTLMAGDLIMTGTPEGVGPLQPGDTCVVEIDGLAPAEFAYLP